MESLLFRFSHRIFGILVYWDFRMTERYNKKLLEHMNVIYSSIYTPVRDKKSQIKVGNLAIYLYLYS